jgi:hypothetical protein
MDRNSLIAACGLIAALVGYLAWRFVVGGWHLSSHPPLLILQIGLGAYLAWNIAKLIRLAFLAGRER